MGALCATEVTLWCETLQPDAGVPGGEAGVVIRADEGRCCVTGGTRFPRPGTNSLSSTCHTSDTQQII